MAEFHDVVSDPFTVTLIRIKARQLCRRSDFSRSDYDDIRQSMRLYLLEKAHLFDPVRGNLEAFVTNAITTLGAVLLEEDGQRLTRTYPLSAVEQFELREAVQHAMQDLKPEDRAILVHVAEHGVASAARAFSRSRRQILKTMARARIRFEKAGLGSN